MAEAKASIEANQGNGTAVIQLFDGRKILVDFKKTTFMKSDEAITEFLAEILSQACWDHLILANLYIRPIL